MDYSVFVLGLSPFLVVIIFVVISIVKDVKKSAKDKCFAEQALAEQAKIDYFNTTKSVSNCFCIDEKRKKWAIPEKISYGNTRFAITKSTKIYDYSDIIDFELIEVDGNKIEADKLIDNRLISSPICSKMQIKITLNNISSPMVYIDILNSYGAGFSKTSNIYLDASKNAQEILSILKIITQSKNDTF